MKIELTKKVKTPSGELGVLNVQRIVDIPEKKRVVVFFKELPNSLVVWKNAEYDIAGQWTDSDLRDRIVFVLSQ